MIHLVTADNADSFRSQIDEMHRLRYQAFIRDRGLNLPRDDGHGAASLDGPGAAYLLKIGPDGRVIGFFRCLPATGAADPARTAAPRGPKLRRPDRGPVWEISRGAIRTEDYCFSLVAEFCAAIVEFALIRTIDTLVFVVDPRFFPTLVAMGWDIRPLGSPFRIADEVYLAAELRIRPETLSTVQGITGNDRPLLAYNRSYSNAA